MLAYLKWGTVSLQSWLYLHELLATACLEIVIPIVHRYASGFCALDLLYGLSLLACLHYCSGFIILCRTFPVMGLL